VCVAPSKQWRGRCSVSERLGAAVNELPALLGARVPPPPVPALGGAVAGVIAEGATLRASLAAPATPSASTKAVGPYRLRIWEQWGDKSIGPAIDIELDGSALTWEGPSGSAADHPRPLTLRFVTIDPVGRESEMTSLQI
jgi:hypothetical protein